MLLTLQNLIRMSHSKVSIHKHSGLSSDNPLPDGVLIKRLLRLAWQFRTGCLRVLLLQIALLILGLFGLGLTGLGIDYLRCQLQPTAPQPHWPFGMAPPADWHTSAVILAIASAILGFASLRALLNYSYSVQFAILLQREIVVHLRATVFEKLQSLSFRFFDDNASGSIINRVTGDVQSTRLFVDGVIMQGIIMLLSLSFYLFYMLSIHVKLTLCCLSATPLIWLLTSIYSRRMAPAYLRNRTLVDKLILSLSETIQGIHVVKGFAREPELTARFADANRNVRDQKRWILNQSSVFAPLIGFVTQINLVILLAYGGYLVIRGNLPLGTGLVVFAGLLQQFSGQVASIATLANSAQESLTAARRVFEVLDAPVEIQSLPTAIPLPRLRGVVTFEHVSFAYEPDLWALQDISFETQAGQRIAIVGPAGSGKSTLLSLIPRFYDPQRGCIRVDGHKLTDVNLEDLRHSVAMVFQESFLFSNTIAANIAFGNPAATPDAIRDAARIAGAHEFIMQSPDGYNTVLREGGANLSGGQRQRLAIARAILLNPAILMLDDPTAAIDPQTEHEILDSMESAMQGRTTFIVAHRISTLRKADQILVLDRGRIIQTGTHEELIRSRGPYQRLASLQMADTESLQILGSRPPPRDTATGNEGRTP
jgi:ATP-binding cassette subfamily B protein